MREIGAQRGLLVAFIVLDNPKNSLLNMQSVSFTNRKPVMKKYLDSFPFPVLRPRAGRVATSRYHQRFVATMFQMAASRD